MAHVCFFQRSQVQYNWYPDMAFDGGKSEGGTLEKGWPGCGWVTPTWGLEKREAQTPWVYGKSMTR